MQICAQAIRSTQREQSHGQFAGEVVVQARRAHQSSLVYRVERYDVKAVEFEDRRCQAEELPATRSQAPRKSMGVESECHSLDYVPLVTHFWVDEVE